MAPFPRNTVSFMHSRTPFVYPSRQDGEVSDPVWVNGWKAACYPVMVDRSFPRLSGWDAPCSGSRRNPCPDRPGWNRNEGLEGFEHRPDNLYRSGRSRPDSWGTKDPGNPGRKGRFAFQDSPEGWWPVLGKARKPEPKGHRFSILRSVAPFVGPPYHREKIL